jgi:subtilisin family serine protease
MTSAAAIPARRWRTCRRAANSTNNGGSTAEIEIEIKRTSGAGTPRLRYIASDNFGPFSILEHNTSSGAIDPDAAAAKGSLAVAAVCWSTLAGNCDFGPGLSTPDTFSSRGPLIRTRDAAGNPLASPEVRQKPNLAGADGVSTSVPGFAPFYGTSAAAPSVAGVAALALSAKPTLSVDQLYGLLTDPANSLDCASAPGVPDTDCGSGFIQADRVVAAALRPPPPPPSEPSPTPATITGGGSSPASTTTTPPGPNPGSGEVDKCKVPKLAGKSLKAAKRALMGAHCKIGKVSPRRPPGRSVVKSSSPGKGTVHPAGTKVSVTLGSDTK